MDARGIAEHIINKHGWSYIEEQNMSHMRQLCDTYGASEYKVIKIINKYFGG